MISLPWVLLKPSEVTQYVSNVACRRRIRGRRNKRNFFTRIKQHYPSQRLKVFQNNPNMPNKPEGDFQGFALESTTNFEGFHDDDIAVSYLESLICTTSIEDPFMEATTRPITVLSLPLYEDHINASFIFKILPIHKRPLRVLSLFDGLCSGLLILKNILHINIEVYFSCEIDEDALALLRQNFFGEVIQLGNVLKLDKGLEEGKSNALLDSLGRIDLLLGGSPCNDITKLNPARRHLKGAGSSGNLTMSFCRIRDYLMAKAKLWNSEMFWFFENTEHMDTKDKIDMDECLGSKPEVCCSSTIVPNPRNRRYHGNVPNLHVNCAKIKEMIPLTLQDIVGPSKQAIVDKVPTITTKGFSRRTGSPKLLPLEVNGQKTSLSIIDYEHLLGFPKSFTDNGVLSPTRRIKLLGKSWSIRVVTILLQPLADIYKCTQDDNLH